MTAPVARTSKGDYLIAGRPFWGFSATKNKGMPTSYTLDRWKKRSIAVHLAGLVQQGETLWAKQIMSADRPDPAADPIIATALDARTGKRDLGTEAHQWIENIERLGVSPATAPGHLRPWLDGYMKAKAEYGWHVEWVERTLANTQTSHPYAGTADLGLRFPGLAGVIIGDTKTGGLYADSLGVQLAAYAHCTHWRTEGDELAPLEGVNKKVAVVLHVTEDGTQVRLVDLEPAWVAWLACLDARAWQEEAKATLGPPLEPTHERRLTWIADRVDAVLALGRDHAACGYLAKNWPDNPRPAPKGRDTWTGHDIDRLADLLNDVEGKLASPFTAPDPLVRIGFRPAEGPGSAPVEAVEAVIARCKALPSDLFAEVGAAGSAAGIGNLLNGAATAADLELLDGLLGVVEAKAVDRMQTVMARADAMQITPRVMADLVSMGKKSADRLTQRHMDRAQLIAGLHADKHAKTANGKVVTTDTVTGMLLNIHGTPERVVEVCQQLVDGADDLAGQTVGSFAAVCSRPLLAALTAAQKSAITTQTKETQTA